MISNIKQYWKKYILCLVYGIVIMVINNTIQSCWDKMVVYANGAFIAGGSLLCYGGLSLCSLFGAYDIFSYMGAKKGPNGVKPSFYDYTLMKNERRKEKKYAFLPYFITGGFYLIMMCIFNAIM